MRLLKKRLVMMLVMVSLLTTGVVPVTAEDLTGDMVYVSTTGDDANNDGSQGSPYETIGHALDSVMDGGTIYIAAGTYYENLTITKSAVLIGESEDTTIIDGSGTDRVMMIDDGDDNTDITVSIEGITIQNGHAPDGANGADGADGATDCNGGNGGTGEAGEDGGGIYNKEQLTMKDCMITNNTAGEGGNGGNGGKGGASSSEYIFDPDYYVGGYGGSAGIGGNGGGIYNEGGMTLFSVNILDNTAGNGGNGGDAGDGYGYVYGMNGAAGGHGGGIYNVGEVYIASTNIINNTAGAGGVGGLDDATCDGGNGHAGGAGGDGGGIANYGELEVASCYINGNNSGSGGNGKNGQDSTSGSYNDGGIGGNGGDGGNGGAIYTITTSVIDISYSFICDNSAGIGGTGGSGGGGGRFLTDYADPGDAGSNGLGNSICNEGTTLTAQNNWWGQNAGPEQDENESVETIIKWIQIEVSIPYSTLALSEEIAVTTEFINNNGDDFSNYIFDGIEVDFSATNGDVDSLAYTVDGKATATYKGTVLGSDTITITLDNEIITKDVTIEEMTISETLPVGIVDLPYEGNFVAKGATQPLTWSAINLPTGLSIDSETGVISGTPTVAGIYTVNVSLMDSSGLSSSEDYTITVHLGSGNGAYLLSPVAESAYKSSIEDTLPIMTVNSGTSGITYFRVEISEVLGHDGNEIVVFIQYRNNAQVGMSLVEANLETIDSVGAGFNVKAGDVIKVFVVDQLTSDTDLTSNVL